MSPLRPMVKQVDMITRYEARSNDSPSCTNNNWDCLNTPAQFGIIFSVIVTVITIIWVYWYAIVRPRQERIKESSEDLELDLGDGRTITVSSGPHRRTVVLQVNRPPRPPTPPPPAYRPPTPGSSCVVPSTIESSLPSPRGRHVQIWPPQQAPPQSMNNPDFVQGHPIPGSYSQPMPLAMYPPQLVVPGPPPPPPVMVHARAQLQQTYHVLPPPPPPPPLPPQPPPAPGMLVQGLVPPQPPPPPPPPPPPLSQPRGGGFYRQPPATASQLRTRPPSPGHASTIEDDDSDRGGSLPPASRRRQSPPRGPSPPPGGSQFTRSRTPSPSERRRQQHVRRRPHPSPSRSPSRGRRRERGGQGVRKNKPHPQQSGASSDSSRSGDMSCRSSTSLDSEMRTDLASLLMEAGDRQRARETERLQALVDRYDREEEEEQAHSNSNDNANGRGRLARLPGQPMRPATSQAKTADTAAAMSVQQDARCSYKRDGEGLTNAPKRRVAFHEPSLEVQESRVGRPSRPPQSPTRLPCREDLHHGESRVGRRRRNPSPDERIVQQPISQIPSSAESRIGRPQPSSPHREHQAWRSDNHRFSSVGESRVGAHRGRKRRETYPPETFFSGAGTNYYNTHDGSHNGHRTADDGILLDEAHSEGPPSSAGATCATRSQASSDSNYQQRRTGLTPTMFNRDRSQRGHEGVRPYLRSPSTEESNDNKREKGTSKSSWVSKLVSFLPTIARLTTNNPVVQELADDVAVEVGNRNRRAGTAQGRPPAITGRGPIGHEPRDNQQAHLPPRHSHRFPDHHQRGDARRPQPRSYNNRYRSHGRRPSTIPEEPRESLQLALEHAAERLAEGAAESALDRARHHGGGPDGRGGGADVMSGQDDRCRRRPRRSKGTES